MDRRRFLSSTILGGVGIAAASPARAFTIGTCEGGNGDSACRELAKHDELLARIDALLAEKGMNEADRKVAMAAARCPFCGSLLV